MTPRLATLALLAGLVATTPGLAQTAPEGAEMDMWCGFAFTIVPGTIPDDADEETQAMAAKMTSDGAMLLERSTASFVEAGFTQEQIAGLKTELEPEVARQIQGSGNSADYTYDECLALTEPQAQ